jgi:hypothetical protein
MQNEADNGRHPFGVDFLPLSKREKQLAVAARRARDLISHVWLVAEEDRVSVYSVLIPIQENRRHSSQHFVAFMINEQGSFFCVCDCEHFTFRGQDILTEKVAFCVHIPCALEMHEWRINTGSMFMEMADFFPESRILQPAMREFDELERLISES